MKHAWKVFVEHYKSEEHWYVKYLVWTFVGVICFAILVHILKEFNFCPAQKIFDFLSQWALVLSGSATLLLAGTAFWAIMDNRHGRIVDRKERLLNEIIDWAVDISKCGIEKGYPDISNLIDLHAVWLKISDNISDIILSFKEMRGKNQYIAEVVKALEEDLMEASKILIDDFEEHIKLLSLCETYMRDREKAWENAVKHKHKLNTSARKVIEEATKIKTKGIG